MTAISIKRLGSILWLLAFSMSARSIPAAEILRITEVMSSSGTNGTADWFEVTNYGDTSINISGWRMDDNSFASGNSVALLGVDNIAAGATVVFLETTTPGTDIPAFRNFWGGIDTITIGSCSGSGVSFSSNGDGVVLFDSVGTERTPRTNFLTATTGSTFFRGYDAAGNFDTYGSAANGVISTLGTIPGSMTNQLTFTSTNSLGNIGSPGTAIVAVPEPSTYILGVLAVTVLAYVGRNRRKSVLAKI